MTSTPLRRHDEAAASGNRHLRQACRRLALAAVTLIVPILLAATNRAPSPSTGRERESQGAQEDAALYSQGRFVYERNCLVCHGKWGDGKGEMAQGMQPKPRRFSAAVFKFRSTPSGFLPTDEDLARTIRQGISQSSMPAFAALNDREVRAAAEYVKSFSSKWRKPENHAPALPIPEIPEWFFKETELAKHTTRGRELFTALCVSCHGMSGDGKGEAAANLKDAWEEPCPPLDLRQPFIRSGAERKDIYRALLTGLDGTPMPSFRETTSEEQRWELIAHIEQLRREHRAQSEAKTK